MGLAIGGMIAGPTVAIFTSGVFLPVVNWKGALTGFMVGTGLLPFMINEVLPAIKGNFFLIYLQCLSLLNLFSV